MQKLILLITATFALTAASAEAQTSGLNSPQVSGNRDQALSQSYVYWRNRSLSTSANCTMYHGAWCNQAAADAQAARQALVAVVMQATRIDGITSSGIFGQLLTDEMDVKMACYRGNQASCSQMAQIQQLRQILGTKAQYSDSDMDYLELRRKQNQDAIDLQKSRNAETFRNVYK